MSKKMQLLLIQKINESISNLKSIRSISQQDIEDARQDTWVCLLQMIANCQLSENSDSKFVGKIVYNLMRKNLNRISRRNLMVERGNAYLKAEQKNCDSNDPAQHSEIADLRKKVRASVNALPRLQRSVAALLMEGIKPSAIEKKLGLSRVDVYQTIAAIKNALSQYAPITR